MHSVTSKGDITARGRLFGGNRIKLGVMAFNCSHGSTITTVPEAWKLNWADTVDIAQAVDRAGMEALLPVGRWRGYGGPSDFNSTTFESFTWCLAFLLFIHCSRVRGPRRIPPAVGAGRAELRGRWSMAAGCCAQRYWWL